tara:strand:+ start:5595 stop:5783 length:189 start_codon:yes stop_codon:yes gene_type:complete
MDKFSKYITDTMAELKQVSWPSQHQALMYTALVIAISVIVALFLGAFDFVFGEFIKSIVNSY